MISHRPRARESARIQKYGFSRLGRGAAAVIVLASAVGCGTPPKDRNGSVDGAGTGSGASTATGAAGPGGSGASAGTTVGTSGAGGTGTNGGSTGTSGSGSGAVGTTGGAPINIDPSALLPQRIRRLANAEFDASLQAVTGTTKTPAKKFAPDARQNGFTLNDAQRIDDVTAKQIFASAQEIAADIKARVTQVAPCANMAQAETCAAAFITSYGERAYRRPLTTDESDALLTVYKTAVDGGTYADGIELVVTALLNSAGFLYLTELGASATPPAAGTVVPMLPREIAHSLAFIANGRPADDALLASALSGGLDTPEGRETAFLALAKNSDRLALVLKEWTGVDRIAETDKDASVYPQFQDLKGAIEQESADFINDVLNKRSGSVAELLGGVSTPADSALKAFYGSSTKTSSSSPAPPQRLGILNQAAFLASFAHATESSPVLRGVDIARRVACIPIAPPSSLNITVVPAQPDPTKTTRERFAAHVADDQCLNCHKSIDPFGFAFEQYDGMGQFRNMENGKKVDSSTVIALGGDFDGPYPSGNELAKKLATSSIVATCFARYMFRSSVGREDIDNGATEAAFLEQWRALPAADQKEVVKTLLAFVKSPLFTQRRAQ